MSELAALTGIEAGMLRASWRTRAESYTTGIDIPLLG